MTLSNSFSYVTQTQQVVAEVGGEDVQVEMEMPRATARLTVRVTAGSDEGSGSKSMELICWPKSWPNSRKSAQLHCITHMRINFFLHYKVRIKVGNSG